ncbi:unnamed protein product [Withania somnifera]
MASYQLSNSHSDHQQVQNGSEMQRGCSKAQTRLFKILRIISTVPPHNISSKKLNGFAVDLNIEFNVPSEKTVEEQSGSPVEGGQSTSTADEKCTVAVECGGVDLVKCSDDGGGETPCRSDNSVVQLEVSETSKSEEKIGEELKEEKGFMGLLIEAATLIFGDFKDEKPKSECEAENKSFKSDNTIEKLKMDDHHDIAAIRKELKRRNDDCAEEVMEDKSSYPLVRSKRGRIQVLPNKYKDSILEPLTPFSRTRATIVPNRRRPK